MSNEGAFRLLVGEWHETEVSPRDQSFVLLRLLRVRYAPLRALRVEPASFVPLARAGLVLGIPSLSRREPADNQRRPIDKLVRAMSGQSWSCLVVAKPVGEETTLARQSKIIDEVRRVESASSSTGVANPLAQRYVELLQQYFSDVNLGLTLGLWRVAVYLRGTQTSYAELAALWRGLFSGPHSVHAPLRAFEDPAVATWARGWCLPNDPGETYLRPFAYQTLLNSAQLATLTEFPSRETTGFAIRRKASFDVAQARRGSAKEEVISIGAVEDGGVEQAPYTVKISALQRHAFISGVTGSGKTNTIFHMLRQLGQQQVPFLVLEPAKNEYRALTGHPQFKDRMHVFTVGDETATPLRMNPFEAVGWPAVPIGVHIDLLR